MIMMSCVQVLVSIVRRFKPFKITREFIQQLTKDQNIPVFLNDFIQATWPVTLSTRADFFMELIEKLDALEDLV